MKRSFRRNDLTQELLLEGNDNLVHARTVRHNLDMGQILSRKLSKAFRGFEKFHNGVDGFNATPAHSHV